MAVATDRPTSKDGEVVEKAELTHVDSNTQAHDLDARIRQLAQEAPPFYRNANLRTLYLLMIPGCLVPALTLGFDAAMMNGLQAVGNWQECEYLATQRCLRCRQFPP